MTTSRLSHTEPCVLAPWKQIQMGQAALKNPDRSRLFATKNSEHLRSPWIDVWAEGLELLQGASPIAVACGAMILAR
jgi:hypothetical protein